LIGFAWRLVAEWCTAHAGSRTLPHFLRIAIPAIGFGRSFVESGGLLSFGPKEGEAQTAVASIVHRVFQGAKPGEIPVVHQRASWLAVNPKTAEKLSVTISPSVLTRADEVIR
jgi:putative ABC transport system substrate-binding protein